MKLRSNVRCKSELARHFAHSWCLPFSVPGSMFAYGQLEQHSVLLADESQIFLKD
jgi:hypothetical protein